MVSLHVFPKAIINFININNMILFSEFYFKHDPQIFLYMTNIIEDFIICSKLNNIYKFITRMKHNENNVYTEKGEFIFSVTVKYELQKLLYKLDEFKKYCLNFDFNSIL